MNLRNFLNTPWVYMTGELRETERVELDPSKEDEDIDYWASFCFKSLNM